MEKRSFLFSPKILLQTIEGKRKSKVQKTESRPLLNNYSIYEADSENKSILVASSTSIALLVGVNIYG